MCIYRKIEELAKLFLVQQNEYKYLDSQEKNLLDMEKNDKIKIDEDNERLKIQLDDRKNEILKYYRIAKENSSHELSPYSEQLIPDIAKLNTMIFRVNDALRDDVMAGAIVDLCSSYIAYIDKELSNLESKRQREYKEVRQKIQYILNQLQRKKECNLQKCRDIVNSPLSITISEQLCEISKEVEISDYFYSHWNEDGAYKNAVMGYAKLPINAPKELSGAINRVYGNNYDIKLNALCSPYVINEESESVIRIAYNDNNEQMVKCGVRAFALNMLRKYGVNNLNIAVFDEIYFNADVMGELAGCVSRKGLIDVVGVDDKSINSNINLIADKYRKIDSELAGESVYNEAEKCGKKPNIRMIIINRVHESYSTKDGDSLSFLINNSARLGIVVLLMEKVIGDCDQYTDSLLPQRFCVDVVSDNVGELHLLKNNEYVNFSFLPVTKPIPKSFVDDINRSGGKDKIGTKYFDRYEMHVPKKSKNGRKDIVVPFAVDENDEPVYCSFEDTTFAAYVMGAAGSGKSWLLHEILCGLLMNYHPDELELWLMDFKMTEFKMYGDWKTPQVKYVLLDKSENLVFDIIDKLTEKLDERQRLFAKNGWRKLKDVPVSENIPAIFVIIDEFAQMSQIISETRGMGHVNDYTLKLENLLTKGRALGFKFIFASQTYTTGVSGLTETACKQIGMRLALKNTYDEMKQTLELASDQIPQNIKNIMADMPPYESIYKWRDSGDESEDKVRMENVKNMWVDPEELKKLVSMIKAEMQPKNEGTCTDDHSYIDKNAVYIDGLRPKTMESQMKYYLQYEENADDDLLVDDDTYMYAGVPCSFRLADPFILRNENYENILLAGEGGDQRLNIILSLVASYTRMGNPVEIWGTRRTVLIRKYGNTVFKDCNIITDLEEIGERIIELKQELDRKKDHNMLIVVFDYMKIMEDMENVDFDRREERTETENASKPDLNEVMAKINKASTNEEKQRLVNEYRKMISELNDKKTAVSQKIRDISLSDVVDGGEYLIQKGSYYGMHFLLNVGNAQEFDDTGLKGKMFRHKIAFPMSRDDSYTILGDKKASLLDEGTFIYSDGHKYQTMRPHIHKDAPYRGWILDSEGNVVEE